MQTNRSFDIPQWAYALVLVIVLAGAVLLPRDLTGPALLVLLGLSLALGIGFGGRRWWGWASARTRWHPSLRWTAFGLAVVAGLLIAPPWGQMLWPLAILVTLVASALVAPTLALAPLPPTPAVSFPRYRLWHGAALLVSLALLLLIGLIGTDRYGDDIIWPDAHAQYALLWLAVGGVVLGLGGVTRLPSRPRLTRTGQAILVLMLMGLVMRLLLLGTHLRYMPDEWIFASAISRFNPSVAITEPVGIYAASTWVFVYWQHALSALVGGGLFGLRFTSALIGTLTVAATGWLAWELYDQRRTTHRAVMPIALTTTAVLVFFPAHIHYSRLALYNVADPLFGVVAAALLARALRTGNPATYVLGGAVLGLTQYFYEAGRLLFIPLFGVWALALLLQDPRGRWRGLLLAAVAALVIGLLPWFPSVFDNKVGTLRLRTGSYLFDQDVNLVTAFIGNLGGSLLMFTTTPDKPGIPYYGGDQGLVPLMWLPFFLVGGVLLLARPLRLNHLFPLLWLGGIVAGVALLRDPSTPRFVIALPLLALVCALGLNAVAAQLFRREWVARAVIIGVLAAFSIGGTLHYFIWHIPRMNGEWLALVSKPETYIWEDLAYRMPNVPDGNYVVIIAEEHSFAVGERYFRELITYFNPTVRPLRYEPDNNLEPELWLLSGTDDISFFIQPGDGETLRLLEKYFVLSSPIYSSDSTVERFALVRFDVLELVNDQRPEFPAEN